MPEVPAARAWPLLLLLAIRLGATAGAPQPWHCAPCSAEKLALCPPVPDSCAEAAPPASCGCCPMCTLPPGAACGVATARCATGLSCRAPPETPRPLHALIRGQGVCGPTDPEADAKESSESSEITQEQLLENFHLMAPSEEDMPVLWNAISSYKTMRAGYASDSDSDKLKVRPRGRCQADPVGFPGARRPGNECFPPQGLMNGRFPPQLCPAFPAGTSRRRACWVESQPLCCVASDLCLSHHPKAQPGTLRCSPRTSAPCFLKIVVRYA
ncbi:insulin-like growth factor-binding protein 1 isoform X1 [Neomonachus schauinslandi]|uniref:Insulin-like growth factor-binding protein 1 isoform X1 n=1 Tax=Neomonachus schauinslandi TaxID=29088 RepID=A0A8M1MS64_NEOSC|nr:insulin-like growth factor-binding protein 1 isoform X1 [Neomonachus schauinslandi]